VNEGGTCPKLEHIDMDTTEDDLTGLASEAGPAVPAAVARKGKSRAVDGAVAEGLQQQAPMGSTDDIDLDKLVMNFLVVEGHKDAAVAFQKESGVEPGADLNVVEQRMEIRAVVQQGNVVAAIERINDLNPEILDTNSRLYFQLYLQQLIELIAAGKTDEALDFATEELAPLAEENATCMEELEEVMALFAFPNKAASPVGHLLEATQRQKTASELNRTLLASQFQEPAPRLHALLKLMSWAQELLNKDERTFSQMDLAGNWVSAAATGEGRAASASASSL